MAPLEDLEGDCCEEELSEAQVAHYEQALKEHEDALTEANSIKKGSSVTKQGNVWTVKSTYQVKLQNAATLSNFPLNHTKHGAAATSMAIQTSPASVPASTTVTRLQPILPAIRPAVPAAIGTLIQTIPPQIGLPVRSIQSAASLQNTSLAHANKRTLQEAASAKSSKAVESLPAPLVAIPKSAAVIAQFPPSPPPLQPASPIPSPPPPVEISPPPKPTQTITVTRQFQTTPAPKSIQAAQAQASKPVSTNAAAKPNQSGPVTKLIQTTAANLIQTAQLAQSTQTTQAAQPVQQKKTATPEISLDAAPKTASKSMPSLSVVVKPSKTLPEVICLKKREALDAFVKSRLVLDSRKFAEWLTQAGLIRNQQQGMCRAHHQNSYVPFQLRLYEDMTKFPNSGGYVWMSKCCDKNFVSIFRDSIFEDSPHPPSALLKLIYHWACQTAVNNVAQWVKVDHAYIRTFYAMLRSACTVEVHSSTPIFGLSTKNNHVEVGVISLGTTSTDGKRRDVKVEVLGVYDQESRKFRLRASEPIIGDNRSKPRFTRILEPLKRWVSQKAVILTDHTVDKSVLVDLGYTNIVQKSLSNSAPDDEMTNKTVMEYLRKVVPKVFQSTLSLLSTATIQQFLDELLWREAHGPSQPDAFHNMVRDLSTQSRAEYGMSLVKRLAMIAADPFKDWGLTSKQPVSLLVEPQPHVSALLGGGTAIKRPAPVLKLDSSQVVPPILPKEPRISSYYATMHDLRKENQDDPRDAEVFCQVPECSKFAHSNLDMMEHLRQHLAKESSGGRQATFTEHCNYCLTSFADATQRAEHEKKFHTLIASFKVGSGRNDSATVKDVVCVICHDVFPSSHELDKHLEKLHVLYEMPYRCRVCFYHSSSHSMVIEHFREAHKTSTQLLCPLCLDVFSIKGDNLANSPDVGHLKYLEHMKTHLKVPAENRLRCKKCILTYIEHDKLITHWKTEHASFSRSNVIRPFTVSLVKSQDQANPTVSTSEASAMTSPISLPSPPPVAPTRTIKTYAKESVQDIPNMTMAKRYNVSVCEDSSAGSYLCIECKDPLRKKNHFIGYFCCMMCRFSTCCFVAMRSHQNQAHKPPLTPLLGSVFALDRMVRCECGFTTQEGIAVERHMKECGTSSVTIIS